jgi:hypothetical protein
MGATLLTGALRVLAVPVAFVWCAKRLRPGRYTFEVRSVSAGIDGTPAGKGFTIT